jgi:hypothetical protein
MGEEYSDQDLDRILDRVSKWGAAFSESKHFEALTAEQKQESESVVMFFAEYMYSYLGLTPEKWNEPGIDECCLDVLPRKISADGSFFKAMSPVLSAFFAFLAERRLLKNAARLARKVAGIDKQVVRNAADPRNWGMAKSFVMAAQEAGVDVTNEEELNQFTALRNLQQLARLPMADETEAKPQTGRNDPCPCGSGKKYKQCCGRPGR